MYGIYVLFFVGRCSPCKQVQKRRIMAKSPEDRKFYVPKIINVGNLQKFWPTAPRPDG